MNTMIKAIFCFFVLLIGSSNLVAQNYEEEIGFTFVKAKYLFDTDRYDDAIRELNRVINENPSLEDALVYRAKAKYNLSAYLGTKKDILTYIELKGITPEAITMLAKAEYQLSEFDAALNTLTTALQLVKDDVDLYEFRASILMDRDERLQACADWEAAARLGSGRAVLAAKRNCGIDISEETRNPIAVINDFENEPANPPTQENNASVLSDNKEKTEEIENGYSIPPASNKVDTNPAEVSEDQGQISMIDTSNNRPTDVNYDSTISSLDQDSVIVKKEPVIDPRLLDNSKNEIVIDEDLTLIITGQGLGSRDLLRKPNILILSDEEGEVVIDICVSRGGRIVSTQYNESESTLQRKSLVSLALRKSKDFWFDKSDLMEQCGRIVFQVKGI
jgi:tetratricopeptide (TPR) repeat protein